MLIRPGQFYCTNCTILYKCNIIVNTITAEKTDDHLGRSTLLTIVDNAIYHFKPTKTATPNFFFSNINLINISDYGKAIDQVALTIAHYSNTISQPMDYQPNIGSVLTLHLCSAHSITATTLPKAVPHLVVIYQSCQIKLFVLI